MNAIAGLDSGQLTPAPGSALQPQPDRSPVLDFMQRHLTRALAQRVRYRYVKPMVWPHGDGYRVESPCCSRNVDPTGGLIDIALLMPHETAEAAEMDNDTLADTSAPTLWSLFAHNHTTGSWVWQSASTQLDTLLDELCVDTRRVFWP